MHPLFEYALPWIKWAISIARSYQELIVTLIALYISFIIFRAKLRREITDQTKLLEQKVNELSGQMRSATRSITNSINQSIDQARPKFETMSREVVARTIEKTADELREKLISANKAAEKIVDFTQISVSDNEEAAEAERWGEMKEMWASTKDWLDDKLSEAIDEESTRRSSTLSSIDKRNYDDVILQLWRYGWLNDDETDYALELSTLYRSFRTRRRPVTVKALEAYTKIYENWTET